MKHLNIILLFVALFISCKPSQCIEENKALTAELKQLRDSVYNITFVPDTVFIIVTDTVVVETEDGYLAKLQVERIKHYVSISESRPTNKKYFFGWVKRTVSP